MALIKLGANGLGTGVGGSLILLSTQTANSSTSIEFTSGIDSTYDSYMFKCIGIHPSVNSAKFQFNLSTDGGSNYNVTKTSSAFKAYHHETDGSTGLTYDTGEDLAQSTSDSILNVGGGIGNDNDQNASGTLTLYNPSSTTLIKHYISNFNNNHHADYSINGFSGGYGNTTSSINAIIFRMDSGNIDSGKIAMYGVK